jgi:glutathione S-transferase
MKNLSTQQKQLRLITIPVSHYCEKARWALTKLKLPYVEEAHMPPFH